MSAIDVFAGADTSVATYRAQLQVKGVMVGGIPGDASTILKWLQTRLDANDVSLQELAAETLAARFPDRQPTRAELAEAVAESGAVSANGFKRDAETGELCYEGRCMKAALKEWANSAYPGTDWPGKTKVAAGFRKGLMSTLAERVFVTEALIGLGVKEPTRIEERIKHVKTPQGPRSAINRVEVVEHPLLTCTIRVHDDFLPQQAWARIWERGEDIGVGSDRARSDGQFELLAFERA